MCLNHVFHETCSVVLVFCGANFRLSGAKMLYLHHGLVALTESKKDKGWKG